MARGPLGRGDAAPLSGTGGWRASLWDRQIAGCPLGWRDGQGFSGWSIGARPVGGTESLSTSWRDGALFYRRAPPEERRDGARLSGTESDGRFWGRRTVVAGKVANDRSANERGGGVSERTGLVKRGFRPGMSSGKMRDCEGAVARGTRGQRTDGRRRRHRNIRVGGRSSIAETRRVVASAQY